MCGGGCIFLILTEELVSEEAFFRRLSEIQFRNAGLTESSWNARYKIECLCLQCRQSRVRFLETVGNH